MTTFELVFFHANTRWLEQQLPVGAKRVISGKVEHFDGRAQIVHPDFILPPGEVGQIPDFEPVYRLTAGVTGKTVIKGVGDILTRLPMLQEWSIPL